MISFQAKMRSDIYALYKGILYGFCPCHGYNKKEGKTGGFYHMVCRHGVSYINFIVKQTPLLTWVYGWHTIIKGKAVCSGLD